MATINRTSQLKSKTLIQRQVILPTEHGAWIFLFSPLIIGLVLGARFTWASGLLVIAALAAFLVRQPVTMLVKVISGRRPRSELPVISFWLAVYALVGLLALGGLLYLGYTFILLLAIPALPVLGWHLWLVSRRAERHQMAVELAGSAVLCLAAPAAYWVGRDQASPTGWLIGGLVWLQIAGSIVYTYLRLRQRRLDAVPDRQESFRMGRPALAFNSAVLLATILLSFGQVTPLWMPAAFAIQWFEVLWGIFHPAVKAKPGVIGTRQLIVSLLFTAAFLLAWIWK